MQKAVVAGGNGGAGRPLGRELLEAGHQVMNADTVGPDEPLCPYMRTDLTDPGDAFEVLPGAEGVVHLAAVPAPGRYPEVPLRRVEGRQTFL